MNIRKNTGQICFRGFISELSKANINYYSKEQSKLNWGIHLILSVFGKVTLKYQTILTYKQKQFLTYNGSSKSTFKGLIYYW